MKRIAIVFLVLIFLFLFSWFSIPFSAKVDFQVLYNADQGILHGVPLYDHERQAQLVADQAGVPVNQVFVLPFPYPPWYAISTLFLVMFPLEIAARIWLFINLLMLMLSAWLLTNGLPAMKRASVAFSSILFLPVLGSLLVGQYVFPTLLGMALLIYAIKNKSVGLTATGMALLTFKPHIGLLILFVVMIYLILLRNDFGRSAFVATLFAGVLLFFVGFIADLRWPYTYLHSLLEFRKEVSECLICVSFPIKVAELTGYGFEHTLIISAFILFILTLIFLLNKRQMPLHEMDVSIWFAQFTCIVMLVVPYLENYDFSFLLIPWIVMIGTAKSRVDWFVIVLVFFIPWVFLGFFGRDGNDSLILISLITFVVLLTPHYTQHTMQTTK